MFDPLRQNLQARSAALLVSLETRLDRILIWWLVLGGLACAARVALSPIPLGISALPGAAPYLLLVTAPFLSTVLALRWFAAADEQLQPVTRMARLGTWQAVSATEARKHALYGTSGIMVSLLVGMLLNVPVRAVEYLASMPPISARAPQWLSTLHFLMSFDVVLFTSLYMIAFVAALRRVPLFPRLLAAIWLGDVAMQLFIAKVVTGTGNLPNGVGSALHGMLEGNVKKVLISVAVWLPYLLMSTRVNVTYRHRLPA